MSPYDCPVPLVLPAFHVFDKQDDPPHRHRVLVSKLLNETRVELVSNWPQTKWWVVATVSEYRAAKTLATTSEKKAQAWLTALEAGAVEIEPWLPLTSGVARR